MSEAEVREEIARIIDPSFGKPWSSAASLTKPDAILSAISRRSVEVEGDERVERLLSNAADNLEAAQATISRLTVELEEARAEYLRRHREAADNAQKYIDAALHVQRLQEALEPFAQAADKWDAVESDYTLLRDVGESMLEVGDLRRARSALSASLGDSA